MIGYQSVMTAVFEAVLGAVVGVVFGDVITTAMPSEGLTFALPTGQRHLPAPGGPRGVLAAILPARRAASLDVFTALQHQ